LRKNIEITTHIDKRYMWWYTAFRLNYSFQYDSNLLKKGVKMKNTRVVTKSIFGPEIDKRCPGYTPWMKFLVFMGLFADHEASKNLEHRENAREEKELEDRRPKDAPRGGKIRDGCLH